MCKRAVTLFHSFPSVLEQWWFGALVCLLAHTYISGNGLWSFSYWVYFFYPYHPTVLTFHGQTVSISEWSKFRHSRRLVENREWPSGVTQSCHALSSQEQNNLSSPLSKTIRCLVAHHLSGSLPRVSCHGLRTDQSLLTLTPDLSLVLPVKWGGLFPVPPVLHAFGFSLFHIYPDGFAVEYLSLDCIKHTRTHHSLFYVI